MKRPSRIPRAGTVHRHFDDSLMRSRLPKRRYNSQRGRCFARSGAARQNQNLAFYGGQNRLYLDFVIGDSRRAFDTLR